MKKIYLLFLSLCFIATTQAQLTGTKNIPGDYGTLAAAITDLNTVGVGAGGVTLNVIAGNPQTSPSALSTIGGGYVIGGTGSLVLTTTSAANPVIIQGNGNTITAPTGASPAGHVAGQLNDAIIKLVGADWITITGFTLMENAGNTVTAGGTNNMTEFGIALFYASATDGSQNNTILNNTISLNRTYQNAFGIYSNVRTTTTSMTTSAEVATSVAGSNSFNKVYGNAINNVNYGIIFIGAVTTLAAIDNGNDIGGNATITGNILTNWGGVGVAPSGYISLTGANTGIVMHQQINDNISYNTITSFATGASGSMLAITLNGIAKTYAATPTGTITSNITFNTITVTSAPTSGFAQAISSTGLTAQSTSTLNLNNNNITNCAITGAAATTGGLVGITNSSAFGTLNINNNIFSGNNRTGTTGQVQGITNTGAIVNTLNINNNQFGTATADFVTTSTATSGAILGISNSAGASTCNTTIQNNDIRRIVHSVAATSAHTYISSTGAVLTNSINNNTFTNLSVNTSGSVTLLSHSYAMPAGGSCTVNNNSIVTAFNKTVAGGTITCSTTGSSSPNGSTGTYTNNNFSNITVTGATAITGFLNNDGSGTSPTKIYTGNTLNNWTGGTSSIIGISVGYIGAVTSSISNNTVTNITGQGAISPITIGSSFSGATTLNIANNVINNITSSGTGGAVFGITCSNASTTVNVNNNIINGLSSTGASSVSGIVISGAGAGTNVFKNKIYNISGSNASSTVNGILVSSGTTISVYNNLIGALTTPAANAANPLNGLNITGGTTVNAYFNTINIAASSSGALFGSSAISASTTPALTLRNNIFVNSSSTSGAGLAVAYRRSTATLISYASASNKNLFNASTIYTDGTTPQPTFAAYQALVAPRDANSISETPNFVSLNGNDATFLHINTTIATAIDNGGDPISGITDDYDGDTRNATTPDIGADEFTVAVVSCTGQPAAGAITPTTASRCNGQTYSMSATGLTTGTGITYQWQVATVAGGPYTNVTGGTGATTSSYTTAALAAGLYYYVLQTTCSTSGQTNITNEVTVTVNSLPTVTVTPTSATICQPGATAVPLMASGASTYTWSPTTGLTPTTGANVSALPTVTTSYVVTGTDGNGCVNTATAVITVNNAPVITSVTATPTTVCSGANSQLQANVSTAMGSYTFSAGTGAALDPMTGATTVLGVSSDDTPTAAPANIGFTFSLGGTAYTQYSVSPDGWILLGSTVAANQFSNSVTSTTNIPKIYPYWDDMATGTDGSVQTLVTGSAPNRIFIVQWKTVIPRVLTDPSNSTMQAWLYEGSNRIEYRYGTMGVPTSNSISAGVTIGATNFQSITYSTNTSSSSTANNVNAIAPPAGTIYTYVPPVLTYSWSPTTFLSDPTIANPVATNVTSDITYTVTVSNPNCSSTGTVSLKLASYNTSVITQPSTTAVVAGSTNNQIILIDVTQACTAETSTQFDFTNVSTVPTDVSAAKVFYNTTNNFATATLFGTTATPAAAFVVTGSQALSTTTRNYFWLVYDIACNATNANTVDAGLTSFTVGASTYSPTPSNPTGTRTITGLATLILTNQPSTTAVSAGAINAQVLRVDIPATACGPLTDLVFNTNGSTNAAADLSKARVYYTTTTTFATTSQFGAEINAPAGALTFTGSQALSTTGTNYFWLVYDINCAAINADVIDAEINTVTTGGNSFTPTTVNPTGTRAITGLQAGVVTFQPTGVVLPGTINQQVLRVLIPATSCGPLTDLVFNTNGSTNAATDLSKARVYYNTTTTFVTTTQFGAEITAPAGVLNFTGSQTLSTTLPNYFWLVYDINCTATPTNVVDAEINSIVTGGTTLIPTTPNPAGTRAISALYSPTRADGNGTTAIQFGTQNAQFVNSLITGSATCPGTVTDINFTATNANPTDVVNAKAYYTTTATFSSAVQFGSSIPTPASGALTFTGSQLLATGANYFWVVYDISCTGTVGALVNADINSLVLSGNTIPVTGTATAANILAAVTNFTTVADGEWSNTATWACGNVPPSSSTPIIIDHNITVSNAGNIGGNVTVNSGKSLTVNAGGGLTLGVAGGDNRVVTNNGTLSVTGGALNINGNLLISSGSTFNQSGGDIIIDPNSGVVGTSVAAGTTTMLINSNLGTVTAGTIRIVDPNFNSTGKAFDFNASPSLSWATGHTLIIGDPASVNPSANTSGFILEQYTGSGKLALGNLIIDGGAGANKLASLGSWSTFVNGDLTVNANSFFTIGAGSTGAVIAGNITNNGTITQSATTGLILAATSGTTTVVNPNAQTIGGPGVFRNLAASPTAELNTLTINNSSAAGVTIATPLRISGTLTLTSGIVNTTLTNLLTLGYNATNVGVLSFTSPSRITGPFKRWISAATGARSFPVGNATFTKYASTNFTTAPTTAGTLTAMFSSAPPSFPNASPLMEGALIVNSVSKQGSWFVDAADGLAGGTYTPTFTGTGANDIVDFSKTVLIKRPSVGGDWTLDGVHVTTTGSNTAPVMSRTGMTGFSEFAIGGESSAVLPVTIEFFRGSKLAASNYLDWKVTCTSQPSVQLSLERSADGRNFTSIDDQTASAVRCLQGFNYTDNKPLSDYNYYRLKTTSPDGKISYSTIVVLLNKEKGFELISLAPNPVKTTSILSLTTVKGGKIEINVSDITGKVVSKQSVVVIAGNNPITMNFAALGAGTYVITAVNAEGEIKTTRFVKF